MSLGNTKTADPEYSIFDYEATIIERCPYCEKVVAKGRFTIIETHFDGHSWRTHREKPIFCCDENIEGYPYYLLETYNEAGDLYVKRFRSLPENGEIDQQPSKEQASDPMDFEHYGYIDGNIRH